MEMVLRRYAEKQPGLEIQSGVRVNRAIIDTDQSPAAITGLEVQPINPQSSTSEVEDRAVITADLYVNAEAEAPFQKWIEQAGLPIQSESHDAEIVYYTRHYKLKPGGRTPRRGKHRSAGDLGYLKYGVFPGEDGHFAVIVCVPKADGALHNAVKDNDEFDAICRAIPGLQPWVNETAAIATTDAFGMGNIKAEWHDYVNGDRPLLSNISPSAIARLEPIPCMAGAAVQALFTATCCEKFSHRILTPSLEPWPFTTSLGSASDPYGRRVFEKIGTLSKSEPHTPGRGEGCLLSQTVVPGKHR